MAKVIQVADVTQAEIHGMLRLKILSVILAIVYVIIPLEILFNENSIPDFHVFLFLLVLSLGFYSWPFLFCMLAFIWYQVNDEGIRRHGDIRRFNFFVRWEDIERIDRTGQRPVYRIFLRGGQRMGSIYTTSGTSAFIILAKRHLPEEKWKKAFDEESQTVASS